MPEAALADAPALGIDTAFVVYDRARHANGRDEAFHRPQPEALLPLAQALHQRGVRRLLVVLPQASVLLPQALKAGLAGTGLSTSGYTVAKEPWFAEAFPRAEDWARATGWTPGPA